MSGIAMALAIGAPVLAVGVWGAATYNKLVTLGNRKREAWSGILVQLKRRHDLAPNLVAVVKGYAAHEKSVFEEIARQRSSGFSEEVRRVEDAERDFSGALIRLMAIAEKYPELRADRGFCELQNTLVRVEDEIQMARRYFNGTVRDLNNAVASFPGMLVAKLFSFSESPFFELESPSEADMPTVSFAVHGK